MKTKAISEQLHEIIEKLKDEINKNKYCILIFRFRDGKFYKFEKSYSKKDKEIGIKLPIK